MLVSNLKIQSIEKKNSVSVILGFRNGAKFIDQQIKSIADQTLQVAQLYIFDDYSAKSETINLLRTIERSQISHRISYIRRKKNLGFCKNFLMGLGSVKDHSDYYAFSDQDDIWDPNKLERAVRKLSHYKQEEPSLYCSRTRLVDSGGKNVIGLSPHFSLPPSFQNAMMQNIGGGNTMVMNKAAKDLIIENYNSNELVSHDWWSYLLVSGAGGNVYYDSEPSLNYRQHDNNLVGSNNSLHAKVNRVINLFKGNFKHWNDLNINYLKEVSHLLTPINKSTLDIVMKARKVPMIQRFRGFRQSGVHRQDMKSNVLLIIAVLLGKV